MVNVLLVALDVRSLALCINAALGQLLLGALAELLVAPARLIAAFA